jgi:hypothetical protein
MSNIEIWGYQDGRDLSFETVEKFSSVENFLTAETNFLKQSRISELLRLDFKCYQFKIFEIETFPTDSKSDFIQLC